MFLLSWNECQAQEVGSREIKYRGEQGTPLPPRTPSYACELLNIMDLETIKIYYKIKSQSLIFSNNKSFQQCQVMVLFLQERVLLCFLFRAENVCLFLSSAVPQTPESWLRKRSKAKVQPLIIHRILL